VKQAGGTAVQHGEVGVWILERGRRWIDQVIQFLGSDAKDTIYNFWVAFSTILSVAVAGERVLMGIRFD